MAKSFSKVFSVIIILALMLMAVPVGNAQAEVSIASLGNPYSQGFNSLASTGTSNTWTDDTTILGWYSTRTVYVADAGTSTTGGIHSYGTVATDRALGSIGSNTTGDVYFGVRFKNNTGSVVTSLNVSYTGEQWRTGGTTLALPAVSVAQRLDFAYQAGATVTNLTAGTWNDVDALDFISPVFGTNAGAALDGNLSANRTALSSVISVTVNPGQEIMLRWKDTNDPNNDHALAVDDLSVTASGVPVDAAPSVTGSVPPNGATDVLPATTLSVTFSENVNVTGAWFTLVCSVSGAHPATYSGGPQTFTIDPVTDFANSESCTLTILAPNISDQDSNDPPDNMVVNFNTGFTTIGPDTAPSVLSTFPSNGAVDVPVNTNLTVTFSETVNVSGSWFDLSCTTSGSHPASVSGGPTAFTLNPSADFAAGELCTLTVFAANVSDQDNNDPPDNMIINFVAGFTTFDACAQPFLPIYQIQGSGLSAATTGTVTTKGVVVGDFEGTAANSGFFLQDLNGDGNPATSDGIFVFTGANNFVSVGQVVYVTGFARERFNQTTLNGSNSNTAVVPAANIINCGTGSVPPVDVTLPVSSLDDFEKYEGMLVRFPQPLVIAEYFNYDRFGEIVLAQPLAGETRPFTGTAIDEPGAAANARTLTNSLSRITLDDIQSAQNPSTLRHPNGSAFSLANKFRGGDTVQNAVGVLGFDFSLYRIYPTGPADYTAVNPRTAAPEAVGGTVRVAAMNTLNFFVTANFPTGSPLDNKCGPSNNLECRGWDSDQATEFTRQRDKLLQALAGLNGDIIGLNELENSTGVEPLASIVSGLPGYDYIATGTIGGDAIKVGMIYRPAVVTPVGGFQILDSTDDPRFIDTKSRPSLAQTFEVNATGARFTVVVNHLKSKGSACTDIGDPDLLDGQGNCSQTRRAAAEALVDWLATDPTGSGDPDFIIMGDLNSYAMEDTITEIKAGSDDIAGTADDFTNLISHFQGAYAYSYTFDGQAGYLDHALANASLLAQITGAEDWHINSDEPDVLDYDTSFKPAAQDALYEVNAYRTSDHDPVVVGLVPNAPPTVNAGGPYSVNEGSSVTLNAVGSDPNGDNLTYAWDLDNNGSFETSGQSVSFSAALLDGPSSYTVKVKATDPLGLSAESTATVNVTNVVPSVTAAFVSNSVSCGPNNSTLNITFTDPGVADTHTAVINWGDGNSQNVSPATSPFSLQHTYALAGTYTATVSVSDDDGGTGTAIATVTVNFNTTGFNQPINADGTSVFKYGSTIPVKISFTNCDGSIPTNLAPTIKLTMISGATPGLEINEPTSTSAADTSGVMRFSTNQYIYNLATKPLTDSSATYLITVTIPYNGQTVTVKFGLKP